MNLPTIKIAFILFMFLLAFWDLVKLELPNYLTLPAIALGVILTHNWPAALVLFLIGAGLFGFEWQCPSCGHTERHGHKLSMQRGGDVKLLALMGAWMGPWGLAAAAAGYGLLFCWPPFRRFGIKMPLTPFMFVSTFVFIWFV